MGAGSIVGVGVAVIVAAILIGAFVGAVIGFLLAMKFLPDLPTADTSGPSIVAGNVAVVAIDTPPQSLTGVQKSWFAPLPVMDGANNLKVPLRDEDLESTFVDSEADSSRGASTATIS